MHSYSSTDKMNRRKFLTFASALLPCALAARMLGEKEVHATPTPAYDAASHEVELYGPFELPPFIPRTGFHVEIQELGERWSEHEGEVIRLMPCFRATMRDCYGKQSICSIQSPVWEIDEHLTENRRRALDRLYENISYVIRRRQFPNDTLVYDTEITVNGVKLLNPRYPNE